MQNQLREFVQRFAIERNIQSVEDLIAIGLNPTTRQRGMITDSVERGAGATSFAEAWSHQFVADKFGAATTHWRKLEDRVDRGVGNPCPLLLIGLPSGIVSF